MVDYGLFTFVNGVIKMKKVFSGIFLAMIVIIIASPTHAANIQIKVDGVTITSDVNPESKSNRTMVPLRVISESIGANVKWSDSQVTLTKNDMEVILKLNSNKVLKNGKTEFLDVKPYMKNNRTFVPMRFIAETFGSSVNYKNDIVTIDTKPFVIDGVKVKALQQEYHYFMGGIVEQINGNGYNETIYNMFIKNKGSKVEPPSDYTWSIHNTVSGGYYKNRQFDFLDYDGNSIKTFDLYTLVQSHDEILPSSPLALIHVPTENQWYLFNESAKEDIYELINRAGQNGFVTVISNTLP